MKTRHVNRTYNHSTTCCPGKFFLAHARVKLQKRKAPLLLCAFASLREVFLSSGSSCPSAKRVVTSLLLVGMFSVSAYAADTETHGFVEGRFGARTRNDPNENGRSLAEARIQLDSLTYFKRSELQVRADFLYDDLMQDAADLDLETGTGVVDLREANLLFTPFDWADVKVGRQILTWGTGDLLFINDLFPKDWNAFLLGRDEEYLKAPSDALFMSFFPEIASIDVAYMPKMDADRFIDGSRVSYWNPMMQQIAGQNAIIDPVQRDDWFQDYELAVRAYRPLLSYELALYAYHGFWKSPNGFDPTQNKAMFPTLNVYGSSLKGTLKGGIFNVEAGYYDSRSDRDGDNPLVPNSEFRFLTGYEHEIVKNLTGGVQYYTEIMMNHDDYEAGLVDPATGRDQFRHVVSLRLTQMLMNQNLILSLFTFYSPSDQDAYFRPSATYKLSDNWQLTAAGNLFLGKEDHTFFGQFKYNDNINLGLRYSF